MSVREPAEAEAEVWRRGADGDPDAFGWLFDTHRDRVFRHAFSQLLDRSDAEDAVGVVFLELWRLRHRVRVVEGSVLAWLLATTTNVCRNLKRSRRRYRALLAGLPHRISEVGDDANQFRDARPDLWMALRELPARDARLIALVALEDYSVSEAADALGISAGAARTRLHRVRARIRLSLGHESLLDYLSEESR